MKKGSIFILIGIILLGIVFISAACEDDDDGKDYDVKGEVFDEDTNDTYVDYCEGDTVKEYWCNGDVVALDSYDCFEICSDGACTADTSQGCTESDDGKDYYNSGWAEITIGGQKDKDYDYCVNSNTLFEQYCESGEREEETFTCSSGCINGACSSAGLTCTDSDSGIDYNKTGSATKFGNENATDVCESDSTLKEYYCENNAVTYKTYICDYTCKSGKCMTEQEESEIQCETDEDCPESSEDYCIENSVYYDILNPSCVGGACVNDPEPELIGECVEECENGQCVDEASGSSAGADENGENGDKVGLIQRIINWFKKLFGGG